MEKREFEKLVRQALKALPKRFRDKLQNVDIVIEEGDPEGDLGLYEGVPLKDRTHEYGMGGIVFPDKITLFRRAIEAECAETGAEIFDEIKDTLQHEIAHHFGISDDHMEDAGTY